MRILVLGLAKSGTSAITYRIKLSCKAQAYFEDEKVDFSSDKNIVCKILFNKQFDMKFGSWENFLDNFVPKFDKVILIVRDPRDRLLSRLLFRTQYIQDKKDFAVFMKLLKKKEEKPLSVSIQELAQVNQPEVYEDYSDRLYSLKTKPNVFVITYEDFVDNKVQKLEKFLGMQLDDIAPTDKALDRLVRTKSYGNWKDWFTKSDVAFYKKKYAKFMEDFGYFDKWELNEQPIIQPAHATLYVEKLLRLTDEHNKKKELKGAQPEKKDVPIHKTQKTLIIGLPKSGTTALYYRLLNSIPNVQGIFEKDQIDFTIDKNILVKVVFVPTLLKSFDSVESFKNFIDKFDKVIYLHRDPRDRLISILLYGLRHIKDKKLVRAIVDLIKIKESAPSSINTKELANLAKIYYNLEYSPELDFLYDNPMIFKLKYEDLVDNKLEALEKYLNLKVNNIASEDHVLKSVARTKSYGDWKNWFTPEDIPFFKNMYAKFIEKYHYSKDWSTNKNQTIDPEKSSIYVEKLLDYAQKMDNKEKSQDKKVTTPITPANHPVMEKPKVSIIIPSYNYAWCIDEAIQSVLTQTYQHWELIVIDDGSTDNSLEILQAYEVQYKKIKVFYHGKTGERTNVGLAQRYKLALQKAMGDLVLFLDADDIWDKKYVESKVDVFKRYAEVVVVFNDVVPFGPNAANAIAGDDSHQHAATLIPLNTPFNAKEILKHRNFIHTFSSFGVRRTALADIHFDSPIPQWIDWWILSQLSKKGQFYFDNEPLTFWRRHSHSYNSLLLNSTSVEENAQRFKFMQEKIRENLEK